MLILTLIIIFFFTWSFYKKQLYSIRYGPNIETMKDIEGNRKVYLKSMFEDDKRKSAYYYAMAAKYYALAGDFLIEMEEKDKNLETDQYKEEVREENTETEQENTETEQENTESETESEQTKQEIDELVSLIRKRTSSKILDSLNEVSDSSMKDLIGLVDNDKVDVSKMQNTFNKLAEDMLGSKIENITDLIPPNAFEDAIKTLQTLSESFKIK